MSQPLTPKQQQTESKDERPFNRECRFEEDFVCKQVISESATTLVLKCQNKLDGMYYAVKIQKQLHQEGKTALF